MASAMRDRRTASRPSIARRVARLAPLALAGLLAGCQREVLNPAGAIALQQRNLIYASTGLMLLIIVPVLILIVVFAWHYRKGNADATYDPDFDHSTALELVIWSAPLMIIICLGALTWSSTHLLDPFRPLDMASAGAAVDPKAKPLHIQVVAMDWKWLFIYPDQGVATVNELVLPVNRQVQFDLTATNMMNTFYAPTLAGMIYTMPGMSSRLYAVLNRPGDFDGMSANYSGAGFSDMHFRLHGVDQAGFDRWLAEAKASGRALSTDTYLALEKPSERVPAMRFAAVQPGLYDRVVNRCVRPGTPCIADVMARDRRAGGGNPNSNAAGSGMPASRSAPPENGKPKGELFKKPSEVKPIHRDANAPDSNVTSFLIPPRATGAARG